MTSVASSPWRKFCKAGACALALGLVGCAADQKTYSGKERHTRASSLSGKFEWGVQYYEAGKYQDALRTFERLRKSGAAVPEFDLISFYEGMSHFRLGAYAPAATELEAFLRAGAQREEAQDARLTLLLTYEKLGRWADTASLAAETDKLTLYQNNRALLKLVWARALREQGESLGAKKVLQDALPYLEQVDQSDDAPGISNHDPDQDLWGRYHFTVALVEERDCNQTSPHETPGAKKKSRPRRLYLAWLESTTDCWRHAVSQASEELFSRDSDWIGPTTDAIARGLRAFGDRIQGYRKDEAAVLARHRELTGQAREQLYRLLSTIDDNLKNFKNRGLNPKPLESLRKEVDRLLAALSSPT